MPTTNPRINITLNKEFLNVISKLALRDHMSVSAKTKELVMMALEMDEDIYFSALAEKVERRTTRWVSHEDAWK